MANFLAAAIVGVVAGAAALAAAKRYKALPLARASLTGEVPELMARVKLMVQREGDEAQKARQQFRGVQQDKAGAALSWTYDWYQDGAPVAFTVVRRKDRAFLLDTAVLGEGPVTLVVDGQPFDVPHVLSIQVKESTPAPNTQ